MTDDNEVDKILAEIKEKEAQEKAAEQPPVTEDTDGEEVISIGGDAPAQEDANDFSAKADTKEEQPEAKPEAEPENADEPNDEPADKPEQDNAPMSEEQPADGDGGSADNDDADSEQPSDNEQEQAEEFELVDEKLTSDAEESVDDEPDSKPSNGKKKTAIIVIAAVLVAAICACVFAYVKSSQKEPETTTTQPSTTVTTTAAVIEEVNNPFTNESGYNQDAVNVRPVAIVVENAYDARPQWGMDDEEYAPDIIVEGEVEGGETRMLWMYADYTALPEQIGPIRSARPPFIKFSELFDSIFIHWGQSASKGSYVGADAVFSQDDVDHINEMTFSDKVGLYGRDKSRGVATEHTGVLYGANLAAAIEQEGFRTEIDEDSYSVFSFNSEDTEVGSSAASTVSVTFSKNTATRTWTYNSEDGLYYSSDYQNNVSRKNLLILFDTTEYVVKENYKNGKSETYCNYDLAGGSGKLASLGTVTDITWSVEDGKLIIKNADGSEVNLNTGKTWIGLGSSNYSGTATAQ